MGSFHARADSNACHDALADRHMLAGWITLIAEDRGWDAATVAALANIDAEQAHAILNGIVIMTPAAVLDTVLRRLERRPN